MFKYQSKNKVNDYLIYTVYTDDAGLAHEYLSCRQSFKPNLLKRIGIWAKFHIGTFREAMLYNSSPNANAPQKGG